MTTPPSTRLSARGCIHLVHPSNMSVTHMLAELHTLRMHVIPQMTKRGPEKYGNDRYVVGRGNHHFFRDKPAFLKNRHKLLVKELRLRGVGRTRITPEIVGTTEAKLEALPTGVRWTPNERDMYLSMGALAGDAPQSTYEGMDVDLLSDLEASYVRKITAAQRLIDSLAKAARGGVFDHEELEGDCIDKMRLADPQNG